MLRNATLAIAAGAATLMLATPPAAAATTVASWEMNETSGTVMGDSAGYHQGTIGSDVMLLGTSYKFPYIKPNSEYRPQHIVTVPDAPELNPGTGDWSVTTRFRFTHSFGNMLQKGQGGKTYFKMQAPRGVVSCLFRGADGSKSVNSGVPLNDGEWHTVRCQRSGDAVTMTIDDGLKIRRASGPTGQISNTMPFAIGGKSKCNATTVTCDYWVGEMDYVRIETGY